MYQYKAHVVKVYDADTMIVNIDTGFNITVQAKRIRLRKVDAPKGDSSNDDEKERAQKIRSMVIERLRASNNVVYLETHKSGYDKFVADVWLSKDDLALGWAASLNQMCLDSGLVREFLEKKK